jgi:hypothetical protein
MRLNGCGEKIDEHAYPCTSEEIIQAYGDHRIELQNGAETLAQVLGRLGSETYETPQDVRDALYTGVSYKAIGRRYYSDRDAYALGESGPTPSSF